MKIYIHYKITEEPFGGCNSFFKAFRNHAIEKRSNEITFAEKIKDKYDILFMAANSCGVGGEIRPKEIRKISSKRKRNWIDKLTFRKPSDCKIIHRLDGLRAVYTKNDSFLEGDMVKVDLMSLSDWIIFQSRECLNLFRGLGYSGENYSVIHNGVDQNIFNTKNKKHWDGKTKLKVFSTSWSPNIHKGFEIMSKFSELEEVELVFVGRWCEDIDQGDVRIVPPVKQEELAEYYKDCDVFLFPAENESCPNVVIEALSSGLPVIYHNSGGTPEIATKYGVPLPEMITKRSLQETLEKIKADYHSLVNYIEQDMEIFSIDYVAEQYLKIFREVLNGFSNDSKY